MLSKLLKYEFRATGRIMLPVYALLLVTAAFDVWGFCLGVLGIFILLCTTKPLVGKGYLSPLIPFNGKALLRLLIREPISRDNT